MHSVDFNITIASDEYSVTYTLQPEESSPQHLKAIDTDYDLRKFLYRHLSVNLTVSDEHSMFIVNNKKSNFYVVL